MSVLTTFRVVATEFASTADAVVDAWTDEVSAELDAETFGSRMDRACAEVIAHELTLQGRAAAGAQGVGAITSERVGDLAVSYAGPRSAQGGDDYFEQTPHGLKFLQIRNSRAGVSFGLLT